MNTNTKIQLEPLVHICILPTKDAGPTKFFTAPSDPRGFPVFTSDQMNAHYLAGYEAGRASRAQSEWQPIETAPKAPNKRILLRWLSGQSNWICIGAWASSEDSPRLKVSGCPREGWMPDAGTCIPTNQKDCIGWQPLPSAPATLGETK